MNILLRTLKLILGLSLIAVPAAQATAALAAPSGFVTASGRQFYVNGTTLPVRGANSYDLAYRTNAEIDRTLADLHQQHVTVVRFWIFGDGRQDGFQPTPGALNPDRLAATDYIFSTAPKYNLHVIPVFVNFWSDYGGVKQYLSWAGLSTSNLDTFYTSDKTRSEYMNYVHALLTHVNGLTHRPYSQEPAIFSWELMNEPRFNDQTSLNNWVSVMSNFVHAYDPNHMIGIGLDGPTLANDASYICGNQYISYCSAHYYLDDGQKALYPSLQAAERPLKDYATAITPLNKPLVTGEVGVSKSVSPFGMNPLTVLTDLVSTMKQDGYTGWLVWNWGLNPDTSYGFSPDGQSGTYTLSQLGTVINQ